MDDNPYESPAIIRPGPFDVRSSATMPFRSAETKAWLAVVAVAFSTFLCVVDIILLILQARMVGRAMDGNYPTPAEANLNDMLVRGVSVVALCILFVSAAMFLIWLHAAYRNLTALCATRVDFSPRSAVGFWFVPVLNLFHGYQVMREIWLASDPANIGTRTWRRSAVTPRLKWWWGCWLAAGFVGRIAGLGSQTTSRSAASLEAARTSSYVSCLSQLLAVIAGVLLIGLILEMTRRQNESHRLIESGALAADDAQLQ